jgi:hypothetical protein
MKISYYLKKYSAAILYSVIVITGFLLIYFIDPTAGHLPGCPFHAITGYYCPGCGTVRALHSVFHGQLLDGLQYNPLAVLLLPFLAYGLLLRITQLWNVNVLPRVTLSSRFISLSLAAVLVYMVIRNIPVYPFTYLAP